MTECEKLVFPVQGNAPDVSSEQETDDNEEESQETDDTEEESQETDDNEEESQEVLLRKRNVRLKIMIQEQQLFKLRNDSIRRDREMMMRKLESKSSKDDHVKSDVAAAASGNNALSLE
ncbi:hypothetical protein MKW92_015846 [Papaver armeniacum]|nr:hypothetical protein MKW92_043128 [Papaver armeniacum]KAI3888516.1 hypothetical protein MKW92_015846 [Papaver armeniacum]